MNRFSIRAGVPVPAVLLALIAVLVLPAASAQAGGSFADDFAAAKYGYGGKDQYQGLSGSNSGDTHEEGEPEHAGQPGLGSVWNFWTSGQAQTTEITVCGGARDTVLAVYTGIAVNALTEVASNDDRTPGSSCSAVRFTAAAATKYMIAVDTKASQGSFNLSVRTVPLNDDFADAKVLSGALPISTSVDNRIATKEAGELDHAGHVRGNTVWYDWTAPHSGEFGADTCTGENSNTALAVYTGTAVDELTQIAANDDAGGLCHDSSEVSFEATEGVTYMIALDGNPKYTSLFFHLYALSPPEEEGEEGEDEGPQLLGSPLQLGTSSSAPSPTALPGLPPTAQPKRPKCRKAVRKGKARGAKARAARKARCGRPHRARP